MGAKHENAWKGKNVIFFPKKVLHTFMSEPKLGDKKIMIIKKN